MEKDKTDTLAVKKKGNLKLKIVIDQQVMK